MLVNLKFDCLSCSDALLVLMMRFDMIAICMILRFDGTQLYKARPCIFFSCGRIEDDTYRKQPVNVRLGPYMASLPPFGSHLHK